MRILIVLTVLTGFLALPVIWAAPARAQGVEGLEEIDVEASAFPATRRGCGKKALFRVAMADMYKKGKDPEELAGMKIMKPLVQGLYEEIGRNGLTSFNLKTLNDYQACGKKAGAESRPEKEKKAAATYKVCSAINEVTLGALDAAKRGKSKDSAVNSFGKRSLDVSGTSMEGIEAPATYLTEQVYAKNAQSYDEAVDFAVRIGMNCLNRKD